MKMDPKKPLKLSEAITKKTIAGMAVTAFIISFLVGASAAVGFFYLQAKRETDLLAVVQKNFTELVQNSDYAEVERVLASFLTAAPDSTVFVSDLNGVRISLPDRGKAGPKLIIQGHPISSSVIIGSDNRMWATTNLIDSLTQHIYGSVAISLPLSPLIKTGWIIFLVTFCILFLLFIISAKLLKATLDKAIHPITKIYDDLMRIGKGEKPRGIPRDFEIKELAEMSRTITTTHKAVQYLTNEAAKIEGEKRAKESMRSLLHDISNPIQAQSNLISAFCAHPDDEEVKTLIIEQWPSLEEQIQHLMTLSRHLEIENPKMTLADIFKTVEIGARSGAVGNPTALKLRPGDRGAKTSEFIQHDRDLISRAIANLVRNSIEEGATNVDVWCDPKDLKIHVKDNGPGIPREKLTLLFENRLKSSKPTGSGVGFPTAMRLIKAHKGKILFSEGEQIGAHFIIELGNLRSAV